MKNILLHGLGQRAASWDKTLAGLNVGAERPGLAELMGNEVSYPVLYKGFCDYCAQFPEKVNLCGLSLGGVLALNYAAEHPDRVNSLVLIAAQYKMPKALLRLQNALFRFAPNSSFKETGFGKADFIALSKSMMSLDFGADLEKITCPTAVMIGEKDKPNRKAAEKMSGKIRGCEFHIIENSGHEVNVDAPERLAELLNGFWKRVGENA